MKGTEKPIIDTFSRHIVPIYLLFEKDGEPKHPVWFTAFLLQVRGNYLLATVGHCLDDVETMERRGWKITKARLMDALSFNAKFLDPIPFDYHLSSPYRPLQQDENDYGLLILSDLTAAALLANQILPISEAAWECDMGEPELYFVTGILGIGSTVTQEYAHLKAVSALIQHIPECPSCFNHVALRWYGKVLPTEQITSLEGMSGGPVFAMKYVDGRYKYWLHGIQSAQSPRFPIEPYIAVNLAQPMAAFLAEVAEGKHADWVEGTEDKQPSSGSIPASK